VGKIPQPPPKTPQKRKKKQIPTPPLILSKDGMIESLFPPFIKCPQNFPRVFVQGTLFNEIFFSGGSGVEQGINLEITHSFKFPLFYRRKAATIYSFLLVFFFF
jgi:hypothetical protein